MKRAHVCLVVVYCFAACTSSTPSTAPTPRAAHRDGASVIPQPPTEPTVAGSRYRLAPDLVLASEGLVFPTPRGWFAHDQSNRRFGSFWDLTDHDPAKERRTGLSITIRAGTADREARRDATRCPTVVEETRIFHCGFVRFHGHRWMRIVGVSDTDFVEYRTLAGPGLIRIIGFPVRGDDAARTPIDALIRRAFVSPRPGYVIALPERPAPEYIGDNGAAGVCGDTPGDFAEYSLEIDTPMPRCAVVYGHQRLRVVNHRQDIIVARLGPLVMFLQPQSSVTVREPFRRYLEPGGYSISTSGAGGPEVRHAASPSG